MRSIFEKKKAITELVAYVLLVGLAIGLSVLVYNWLRFYVLPFEARACPDGVSLILQEYSCNADKINLTVRNKGLFRIDGYLIKVNNETDYLGKPQGLPVYILGTVPIVLNPNEIHSREWDYNIYGRIVEVEIEPFRVDNGKTVYCDKAVMLQAIRSVDCL